MQLPQVRTGIPPAIAVSLGRSQHRIPAQGWPVRRRTSGGGAVLAGPWLLRALLVLPRSHAWLQGGPARAALHFGAVHRCWLGRMGIATVVYDGPVVDHWACFAGRAPGELLADGRKITGIAQTWRRRRALLWSGTLLAPVPWHLLTDSLGIAPEAAQPLAAAVMTAQDRLGAAPDAGVWARALRHALVDAVLAERSDRHRLGAPPHPLAPPS